MGRSISVARDLVMSPRSMISVQPRLFRSAVTPGLRRGVVAAEKHRRLSAGFVGINHDVAIDDVQSFDDFCRRQRFLDFFAE